MERWNSQDAFGCAFWSSAVVLQALHNLNASLSVDTLELVLCTRVEYSTNRALEKWHCFGNEDMFFHCCRSSVSINCRRTDAATEFLLYKQ